jgi:hypothetical protein
MSVSRVECGGRVLPHRVLGARVGMLPLCSSSWVIDKLNRFRLVQEVDPTGGRTCCNGLERINSRDYTVHHARLVPAGYVWDSAATRAVASARYDLTA